jgi:inhibitor of KinA sporulation pathway (predicted exonuclease)
LLHVLDLRLEFGIGVFPQIDELAVVVCGAIRLTGSRIISSSHTALDDNVHFQDAARLVQKLIDLEKEFEVMYYPVEPHTIQTEASRYDFVRRAAAFFERYLIEAR